MSMWLIGILVLNLGQVNRYHILPVLRKIKGNNRSMVVPCMLVRDYGGFLALNLA